MITLTTKLREFLDAQRAENSWYRGDSYWGIFQNSVSEIPGWPQTSVCQGETEEEPLDTENITFLRVQPDRIIFDAGGDWQDGATLELVLLDGELKINELQDFDDSDITQEEYLGADRAFSDLLGEKFEGNFSE